MKYREYVVKKQLKGWIDILHVIKSEWKRC